MIWVDELFACRAPWGGGLSCHMMSDESADELLSFASLIGVPRCWFQNTGIPHFDLSPRLRARAIGAGARACTTREMVRVNQRRRAADAARGIPADAWRRA